MKIDVWGDSFKNLGLVNKRSSRRRTTDGVSHDCRRSSFRTVRTKGIEDRKGEGMRATDGVF